MPRVLLLLFLATTGFAQVDALRAEIRAAYTVDPSQPGSDLLRARDFFEAVKTKPNRDAYVEALKAELEDRSNSARMRVDGSVRLLFLSKERTDFALAARVLTRANFREVAPASYWAAAKELGRVNADISAVAFRLLEAPDFHLLFGGEYLFDQLATVTSLLLSINSEYWIDPAIERLASEQDETAQRTLLNLLWYGQTDFADAELQAFAKDPKRPAPSRALAEELLARQPSVSTQDRAEVFAASEDELRERRRRRQAAGVYFKEIKPTIERDTMKILLKRRLASDSQR